MRCKVVVLGTIWIGLACSGRSPTVNLLSRTPTRAQTNASTAPPETLTIPGEQELRTIVESGRCSDLQWPKFSNHHASVKEFYEGTGYKLGWSRNGKPTTQALELVRILEAADQKGLDSRDYDGQRWPDRVKALQSDKEQAESFRVRFDVALTVSAIRYISDLHLGRVDPER